MYVFKSVWVCLYVCADVDDRLWLWLRNLSNRGMEVAFVDLHLVPSP